MNENVIQVVWTRQARETLNKILDYRYKDVLAARKIVFSKQFQKDDIQRQYRKIMVRDYKLLYKSSQSVIYILNIVCTLSAS